MTTLASRNLGFGALPGDRPSGPQVMPWISVGGGKMAIAYHESRGLLGGTPNTEDELSDYDKRNIGIQPVGVSAAGVSSAGWTAQSTFVWPFWTR